MKAAILEEIPGGVVIDEITLDKPGPDEVLITTHACGLCHSDLSIMQGKVPYPAPSVLGHEAAGVIAALGSDVSEFAVGDHVVGCLSAFCGTCRECTVGNTWLCEHRHSLARLPTDAPRLSRNGERINQMSGLGGFAEEMVVHRNAIVKVPHDLPLERAALLGCGVLTGVGSVFNSAKVEPGSTVAVIGTGGIGLNIVQGAHLAGAARIIAVDLHDEKLELAKVFGATDVVNASGQDPVEAVVEMTKGGVDYAFEAIGVASAAVQAVQMIRPGRTAYLVGVLPADATIELPGLAMTLQARGLQGLFMGSNRFKRDIPMLADLYLNGRLKLDELVAAEITIDQINDGFAAMEKGTEARSVLVFK